MLESVPKVVSPPESETGYTMKIIVHPERVLLGELIIEALDNANVSLTVRRIRGTSWEVLVASRRNSWRRAVSNPPAISRVLGKGLRSSHDRCFFSYDATHPRFLAAPG